MDPENLNEIKVSGTLYSYYFLCPRKVWLCAHQLNFEQESEAVQIGKYLDETAYAREKHHLFVDGCVNIDYYKNQVVYEVKKSDRQEIMSVRQVQYYLYVLKKRGIEAVGQINYPLLKKTTPVSLTAEDEAQMERDLEAIRGIIRLIKPPAILDSEGICKKCAYFELCRV